MFQIQFLSVFCGKISFHHTCVRPDYPSGRFHLRCFYKIYSGRNIVKHHKSVTDKVLEANRRNAKKSTGPKSDAGKLAMRHNAARHGLLAKQILFRHHETERNEYKNLLNSLERDYMPVGLVERMLVEEIGTCWWKLRTATRWEIKGLRAHHQASERVVDELSRKETDHGLLDSGWGHDLHQWECETLVIRRNKNSTGTSVSMAARRESPATGPLVPAAKSSQSNQKNGGTEIEATLKSSLPTILRYETTLKRDLYKAIDKLEELQRRRKESERKKHRRKRRHHS